MEESSREARDVSPERIQYFQSRADRLLNQYGRSFTEFTRGNEQLIALGDELIKTYKATGYNVLLNRKDLPITSRKPLIFYSNYIGRTRHFGLLLAEMERDGIIAPEQTLLSVKASEVLYGGWKIDTVNERIIDFQREDEYGNITYGKVSQTVDTVVTFSPRNEENALEIARFLTKRASGLKPGAIEGSFEIPDILATRVLRNALIHPDFEEVVANILSSGRTQLVVGRLSTKFTRPWRKVPFELNEELASYLASRGALP